MLDPGQRRGQLLVGRLHQLGVERPGDGQPDRLAALGLDQPSRPRRWRPRRRRRRCCPGRGSWRSRCVPADRASATSASTSAASSPRTLTMPLGVASAAACIARPRSRTTLSPSSKRHRPGEDQGRVLAEAQPGGGDDAVRRRPARSASSGSRAARLATKMAGWLTSVALSRSAGPFAQTSSRS